MSPSNKLNAFFTSNSSPWISIYYYASMHTCTQRHTVVCVSVHPKMLLAVFFFMELHLLYLSSKLLDLISVSVSFLKCIDLCIAGTRGIDIIESRVMPRLTQPPCPWDGPGSHQPPSPEEKDQVNGQPLAFAHTLKKKGAIVHGHYSQGYLDFLQYPHDPNLTINVLSRCILKHFTKQAKAGLPDKLYIQLDNCGRSNKNQFVLSFLALLVKEENFKEICNIIGLLTAISLMIS